MVFQVPPWGGALQQLLTYHVWNGVFQVPPWDGGLQQVLTYHVWNGVFQVPPWGGVLQQVLTCQCVRWGVSGTAMRWCCTTTGLTCQCVRWGVSGTAMRWCVTTSVDLSVCEMGCFRYRHEVVCYNKCWLVSVWNGVFQVPPWGGVLQQVLTCQCVKWGVSGTAMRWCVTTSVDLSVCEMGCFRYHHEVVCYNKCWLVSVWNGVFQVPPWGGVLQQVLTCQCVKWGVSGTAMRWCVTTSVDLSVCEMGCFRYRHEVVCYNKCWLVSVWDGVFQVPPWGGVLQQVLTCQCVRWGVSGTAMRWCVTTSVDLSVCEMGCFRYRHEVVCYNKCWLVSVWNGVFQVPPWGGVLQQVLTCQCVRWGVSGTAMRWCVTTSVDLSVCEMGCFRYRHEVVCYNKCWLVSVWDGVFQVPPWGGVLQQVLTCQCVRWGVSGTAMRWCVTTSVDLSVCEMGCFRYRHEVVCYNKCWLVSVWDGVFQVPPWGGVLQQVLTCQCVRWGVSGTAMRWCVTTSVDLSVCEMGCFRYRHEVVCYNKCWLVSVWDGVFQVPPWGGVLQQVLTCQCVRWGVSGTAMRWCVTTSVDLSVCEMGCFRYRHEVVCYNKCWLVSVWNGVFQVPPWGGVLQQVLTCQCVRWGVSGTAMRWCVTTSVDLSVCEMGCFRYRHEVVCYNKCWLVSVWNGVFQVPPWGGALQQQNPDDWGRPSHHCLQHGQG